MVKFIMNTDYGVSDIFQNVHATDALEGYTNMVTDQIDNGFFRDMYMETMNAVLTGEDGPEPTAESAANELYDPFDDVAEGCATECGGNCSSCSSATECGGSCGSNESSIGKEYLYGKGKDEEGNAFFRSLNSIPGSDPTDAGTFFNLKDQKPSVESADASAEMQDLISTVPDTDLIVTEGYSEDDYYDQEDGEVSEGAELGLDDFGLDPLI
jgi:hypothetical protein